MEITRIIIANDHAGVDLKEKIRDYLSNEYQIIDLGVSDPDIAVNYALYAIKSVEKAIEYNCLCILICGTGLGVCIAANKIKGARAVTLYNENVARYAKEHNDANVITFGARELNFTKVKKMLDIFLNTEFEGGRHQERLDAIKDYENSKAHIIKDTTLKNKKSK